MNPPSQNASQRGDTVSMELLTTAQRLLIESSHATTMEDVAEIHGRVKDLVQEAIRLIQNDDC